MKGGSEVYLFTVIDELRKRGHEIAAFAMEDPKNAETRWSKYFIRAVDYDTEEVSKKVGFAARIVYSSEARKKIGRLMDAFQPDIVHLHIFQHQISTSIVPEIKKRGIPIVYTAHDLKSICPNYKMLVHEELCERCKGRLYYHCLFQKCVKNSYVKSLVNVVEMYFQLLIRHYDLIDTIVTPSAFFRRKLTEYRFGEGKVLHIPNCVDVHKLVPHFENDGYCLYFGRLSEEKGVSTLIEAMKRVRAGRLIIAGTGPLEEEIAQKVQAEDISTVEMVGFKSREELSALIKNAMCTILPSQWYENGPMSLLESFAFGKPVIGSNIGGIPEHIEAGEDGLLFQCGNSEDLADKINSLYQDPQRTINLGKRAREKAERFYSVEAHMERLLGVYEELVIS